MSFENKQALFNDIKAKLIANYFKANILDITARVLSCSQSLLIYLTYVNSTDLNSSTMDIEFSITLTSSFPIDKPYVNCLSNFTLPTLFDNRNLLRGILNHNWAYKEGIDPYVFIEEIVLQIPSFIKKVNEERNNKLLGFYGYYHLNQTYDINLFMMNRNFLFFYRINLYLKQGTLRAFIILTDIYLLLFHPIKDTQSNMCKLVFSGELRKISRSNQGSINKENTLIFMWDKSIVTSGYQIEFSFTSAKATSEEFLLKIKDKVDMLNKVFVVFEDNDQDKEDISLVMKLHNSKAKIEKYKALIEKKESLYKQNKSLYLIKELGGLYEKMVDLLSADENPEFTVYLDKMKSILNEEGIDNQLSEDLSNKKLFETSKSYVDFKKPKYDAQYIQTIEKSDDLFRFVYEDEEEDDNDGEEEAEDTEE